MEKGSYTFLLELREDTVLKVGSLGDIEFEKGFYAYIGSANGPGGFKRVERHVSGPENIHWHIDHLTSDSLFRPELVVKSPGTYIECFISQNLEFEEVRSFGCSDCDCSSHLFYSRSLEPLERAVRQLHRGKCSESHLKRFQEG